MTYWRITLGRLSTIILFASTTFCLYPRPTAAQDSKAKPAPPDHADFAPSSTSHGDELQAVRQDLNGDSLPDAPLPKGQGPDQNPVAPSGATEPGARVASNINQDPFNGGRQASDLYP